MSHLIRYIGSENWDDFSHFEDLEGLIEAKMNKNIEDKLNNVKELIDKFVCLLLTLQLFE